MRNIEIKGFLRVQIPYLLLDLWYRYYYRQDKFSDIWCLNKKQKTAKRSVTADSYTQHLNDAWMVSIELTNLIMMMMILLAVTRP